jgi:DNA-binding transcriptional regulator PaaX
MSILQFHNLARTEAMRDPALDRDLPENVSPNEWTARELADLALWHSKRMAGEADLLLPNGDAA